jgi:hypothetical protein
MFYQHGDVLIEDCKIPADAKKLNHVVLMDGELTGHKHQIVIGKGELFEKGETLYLSAITDCVIGHEEHARITVAPGTYKIRRVVEYDPFEDAIRSVQD